MRRHVGIALALLCAALGCFARPAHAQPRAIVLADGTPVGVLRGAIPSRWRALPQPVDAWDTGLWAAAHHGALQVRLGATVAPPPAPSVAAVVANELDLETLAGAPFAVLYCAEVEVLRVEPATGRVIVRAYAGDDVTFEGAVRSRPRQTPWGNCGARTTYDASLPARYRGVDDTAAARVRFVGEVFWRERGRCARWEFRRVSAGHVLQRRRRFRAGDGLAEEVVTYNLAGAPSSLEMYAPSTETRWLRAPRGMHLSFGSSAMGGVYAIRFVRADREMYEWIVAGPAHPIRGYHPADAERWYRSLAACLHTT